MEQQPQDDNVVEAENGSAPPPGWRGVARFAALFSGVAVSLLAGYQLAVGSTAHDWYLFQIARQTAALLNTFGNLARLEPAGAANDPWEAWRERAENLRRKPGGAVEIGPHVSLVAPPDTRTAGPDPGRGRRFNFQVAPSCGAIELFALYFAAVLAYPASWRARAAGLAAGLPILHMMNLLRLSFLAWLGARDGGGVWFQFFHVYVWQALYLALVAMLWMAWLQMFERGRSA